MTVCPKSEGANYANCLLKKIEEYRHLIYRDLPDLSLPSLDPFRIPKLSVKHNRDTVDLNLGIKNAVITGAGNFEIKKLKYAKNNCLTNSNSIEFNLTRFPKFDLQTFEFVERNRVKF